MNEKKIAVIGGTGFSHLPGMTDINDHVINTPFGSNASPVLEGKLSNQTVFFLARHGKPHKIAPHKINYRANIWALKELGVTDIIAINAVGGIRDDMKSGALAVPHQIIDYTYGREMSFYTGDEFPLQHIDFSYPFCEKLRQLIICQSTCNIVKDGVYGVTQGPRLETAAEVNRLQRDGVDLVGMTAMPEAILAREVAINYASLCLVVNPAAGKSTEVITMDDIYAVVETGMQQVQQVLNKVITAYSQD